MLEREVVEAAVLGRPASRKERRVSFPEGDDGIVIVQERDDLAIAPDAALIERRVAGPASAPESLEHGGRSPRAGVMRFEERAAIGAIVDRLGNRKARAAAFGEADEFGWHEFLIILGTH